MGLPDLVVRTGRPENPLEYTSTGELYRGSRIRKRRREKGLAREKMANLLGCHPDSLVNVETNRVNPSKQMMSKIAKLLEVPLDEYFAQAPVHPRIPRKKATKFKLVEVGSGQALSPSALYAPTSASHQEILMHGLAGLEEILKEVEKYLHDANEEIRELRALAEEMKRHASPLPPSSA